MLCIMMQVKIIDFGAACDMCTGINFNPLYGMLDPRYSPPEELVMPQSEACCLLSCGTEPTAATCEASHLSLRTLQWLYQSMPASKSCITVVLNCGSVVFGSEVSPDVVIGVWLSPEWFSVTQLNSSDAVPSVFATRYSPTTGSFSSPQALCFGAALPAQSDVQGLLAWPETAVQYLSHHQLLQAQQVQLPVALGIHLQRLLSLLCCRLPPSAHTYCCCPPVPLCLGVWPPRPV
jgi:hypothetical protein